MGGALSGWRTDGFLDGGVGPCDVVSSFAQYRANDVRFLIRGGKRPSMHRRWAATSACAFYWADIFK
jgi:hypothetical protein